MPTASTRPSPESRGKNSHRPPAGWLSRTRRDQPVTAEEQGGHPPGAARRRSGRQPRWYRVTGPCRERPRAVAPLAPTPRRSDRKSTRLNSSHVANSYAVFCLKKKRDGVESKNKNGVLQTYKNRT